MTLRPSLLALAAVLTVTAATAQTIAPPVNVPPSQPRAIEIQPAQPAAPAPAEEEALPPKITLIPGAPAQVAPPAAPDETASIETPEQKAEKAAIRQKAYLVGAWVYDVAMPHGEHGRLRLIIRFREDGTFAGIAQFFEAGGRSDTKIAGQWTITPIANNRFQLDTLADKAGASITIEMLDQHRMLNLTNNVLMKRLTL